MHDKNRREEEKTDRTKRSIIIKYSIYKSQRRERGKVKNVHETKKKQKELGVKKTRENDKSGQKRNTSKAYAKLFKEKT